MFIKEDTTYNDIREKSLLSWLDEMEQHEDIKNQYMRKIVKKNK